MRGALSFRTHEVLETGVHGIHQTASERRLRGAGGVRSRISARAATAADSELGTVPNRSRLCEGSPANWAAAQSAGGSRLTARQPRRVPGGRPCTGTCAWMDGCNCKCKWKRRCRISRCPPSPWSWQTHAAGSLNTGPGHLPPSAACPVHHWRRNRNRLR